MTDLEPWTFRHLAGEARTVEFGWSWEAPFESSATSKYEDFVGSSIGDMEIWNQEGHVGIISGRILDLLCSWCNLSKIINLDEGKGSTHSITSLISWTLRMLHTTVNSGLYCALSSCTTSVSKNFYCRSQAPNCSLNSPRADQVDAIHCPTALQPLRIVCWEDPFVWREQISIQICWVWNTQGYQFCLSACWIITQRWGWDKAWYHSFEWSEKVGTYGKVRLRRPRRLSVSKHMPNRSQLFTL